MANLNIGDELGLTIRVVSVLALIAWLAWLFLTWGR